MRVSFAPPGLRYRCTGRPTAAAVGYIPTPLRGSEHRSLFSRVGGGFKMRFAREARRVVVMEVGQAAVGDPPAGGSGPTMGRGYGCWVSPGSTWGTRGRDPRSRVDPFSEPSGTVKLCMAMNCRTGLPSLDSKAKT